ncbi:hypothetical protein [Aquamicrobium zhengzhouense]|uniref:Uncharacterized protein n=1 Tax=Aquamicrobium zhengzhouense TaxID=2781738 RepID=A0ABS0SDG9_9HYPH|nr:hypothetical protein [Aquamicrobium zhengzhouense]MBI1621349.1 hypothetical protein [Aquamicrobium zhengzhouense]
MMTIGYEELGRPVVAGQYPFQDRLIDVGPSQISIWESDPNIRFTLSQSYNNRFTLGAPVDAAIEA